METASHNSVGFLYTTDHKETVSDDSRAGAYRIVNTLDVPLKLSSKPNAEQAVSKEFSQGEARGSIQQTGVWNISAVVVHTRLRCGTYETGIQLGIGNPACSDVEWLTDMDYGTRRTQCNSAGANWRRGIHEHDRHFRGLHLCASHH